MGANTRQSATVRRRTARVAAWLVATLVVGGLLVRAVGVDGLTRALGTADPGTVSLVAGIALVVVALRGVALGVLLEVLGYAAPARRAVSAYAVTTLVSSVVPGGQAGGAPVNGLVVARTTDADYEDGVAAVVAVSVLTNVVVIAGGLLGVGYLLATAAGGSVARLGAVGVGLFAVGALAATGLWRVRDRVFAATVELAVGVARLADRVPSVSAPDREAVETRADRFRAALGRARGGSRAQVAVVVGLLALAHALTVVALWLSFLAVGQAVSVGVLLAVIPAAVAAAVVPTPGAVGGVDVALVGLLASGTAAVAPVAGAAVLVYRTATSGPALVAGGVLLVAMLALGWLSESEASQSD